MTKLKGQTSLEMSWEPKTGAVPDITGVGLHVQNTDWAESIRQVMRKIIRLQAPDEFGFKQAPLW